MDAEVFAGGGDLDQSFECCGDQAQWGVSIPWAFRALSLPSRHIVMPAAPARGADVYTGTAYWCPLIHLLLYSLGWTRIGRGLRWWYDAAKPTDDPTLRLVRDIWDGDSQLDCMAAWLWTNPPHAANAFAGIAVPELLVHPSTEKPVGVDPRWLDEVRRRTQDGGAPNPLVGGSDPLHLSGHWEVPLDSPPKPVMLQSDQTKREAVLVLESMVGWYRALADAGATLPPLGARSWHVQVIVMPIGSLGIFRRSRRTGLWFSGRHSIHIRGN